MNYIELINELKIDSKSLDDKKQQTEYKIKYVVEYVKQWLIISSERENIKDINFIDCMCNAGIYCDGDLGTSLEVLRLFQESARIHPNKNYNLFINDHDTRRIKIIELLINHFNEDIDARNLNIYISSCDVNVYLKQYDKFNKYLGYASTILFIDPYDLGTVVIENITQFLNRYYCELFFNFFSSDYVRNKLDSRICACIGNAKVENKDDLINYISQSFYTGKIKHVFSYRFNTLTNTEIYQIIFASPSDKGFDVLKQALWKVFNGKFKHRNFKNDENQICIFTEEDDAKALLNMYANEAMEMLKKEFLHTTVPYSEIEKFLTTKTMLVNSKMLKSVIKPLIKDGYIRKCGNVDRQNSFKQDSYTFIKE